MIRHTTPDVAKEICYGQSDIDLNASFLEESKETLKHLPPNLDNVYSSPLKRCLHLAKLIPCRGLIQVKELKEMNFGEWELKAWSDIPKSQLDPWMSNFVNQQVPNGESMKILADRVSTWYRSLNLSGPGKVAIVTHAGPIRILLSEINQTPLEEAFQRYSVNYGEVICIG